MVTRSRKAIRGFVPIVWLAFVCLGAGTASADQWDAERALTLAVELEATLAEAVEASKTTPQQETAMQQRTRDGAVIEMRNAHRSSRDLVTRLRISEDRESTEPFFTQVRTAFEDALVTARNAVPQSTVSPLLDRAESLILSLQALYARD